MAHRKWKEILSCSRAQLGQATSALYIHPMGLTSSHFSELLVVTLSDRQCIVISLPTHLARKAHVERSDGGDEAGDDERQDEGLEHAQEQLPDVRDVHRLAVRPRAVHLK